MKQSNLIGYPIVIILTAIITFFTLNNCKGPDRPIANKPTEIISFSDALELYQTYTDNRSCVIKAFEGKRDSTLIKLCPSNRKANEKFKPSRSFFLSKKFLDQYMAYVKSITPDSVDITGYRMYLGNYPDKEKFENGKPIPDPRRNTFFMAPTTITGSESIHRGFTFVDKNKDGTPELVFLENELADPKNPIRGMNRSKINTASFFSFANIFQEELSTIANDLGSHP
ncbi:hypothetical protein [Aquimarina intermedia]|uniref:Uncharacterized protein n=1 Tax=Aquimarina intermedia TaxID=350814 RepID=A0A5S5C9P2_9FLAO|nr:hypothetical protein [Aquimarina intermedia]TYP76064.1 hypothetical protein BD809_102278 [Aquimarina intermedia]